MTHYLINFILCSGFLLMVFHLLLGNKTLYRFNRAYLLFSLLFSLSVPAIVLKKEAIPVISPIATEVNQSRFIIVNPSQHEQTVLSNEVTSTINYLKIAICFYAIVVALLLCRMFFNLYRMQQLISRNLRVPYLDTWLVLMPDEVVPHSFGNYIFVNQKDYETRTIAPEILMHELAHVKQRHSWDIVLMELLLAVYWFNPFLWFYNKAIRLNHEFLADAAVINNSGSPISNYQYLLVATINQLKGASLASQFNYSITKKRLIMMTRKTSSVSGWMARVAIIPVVIVALMLFASKSEALQQSVTQKPAPAKSKAANKTNPVILRTNQADSPFNTGYPSSKTDAPQQVLNDYAAIVANYTDSSTKNLNPAEAITKADCTRLEALFRQMSRKQQLQQQIGFMLAPRKPSKVNPTAAQLTTWLNTPSTYGVWIDEKRVNNQVLKNYQPDDFDHVFVSKLTPNAVNYKNHKYQIDLMTKERYKALLNEPQAPYYLYYVLKTDKSNIHMQVSKPATEG